MSERQSKSTQDKHERILNDIVKTLGNDYCADCNSKSKWNKDDIFERDDELKPFI